MNEKLPQHGYYQHVLRPEGAPLGVRRVELLGCASAQAEPTLAIYRPLDTEMPVYKAGMWDYKQLDLFVDRYQLITDPGLIAELDVLSRKIYP